MENIDEIELVKPEYWDTESEIPQPYSLYRINVNGNRYYFNWIDKNLEPLIFKSVTTIVKNYVPTNNKYLLRWYGEKGNTFCNRYFYESNLYGTFLHREINRFIIDKKYDLSKIEEYLELYLVENKINKNSFTILDENKEDTFLRVFSKRVKYDLLSFMKFCLDVNFKPVASEIALYSKIGEYAGALDLVGYIDIDINDYHGEIYKTGEKKGLPKKTVKKVRELVIIDIKSGRKGFFEEYEWQLKFYQRLWNENFPFHQVNRIFNWSPNDWHITPSYKFKEQTDAINDVLFDKFLDFYYEINNSYKNIKIKYIKDCVVNFKEDIFTDEKIFETKKIIDIIKSKFDTKIISKNIVIDTKVEEDIDIENLF